MASVKNFQLVTPEDQDSVVLQFGRVAKDEFTMDFQWPMSPFQVDLHIHYIYVHTVVCIYTLLVVMTAVMRWQYLCGTF